MGGCLTEGKVNPTEVSLPRPPSIKKRVTQCITSCLKAQMCGLL